MLRFSILIISYVCSASTSDSKFNTNHNYFNQPKSVNPLNEYNYFGFQNYPKEITHHDHQFFTPPIPDNSYHFPFVENSGQIRRSIPPQLPFPSPRQFDFNKHPPFVPETTGKFNHHNPYVHHFPPERYFDYPFPDPFDHPHFPGFHPFDRLPPKPFENNAYNHEMFNLPEKNHQGAGKYPETTFNKEVTSSPQKKLPERPSFEFTHKPEAGDGEYGSNFLNNQGPNASKKSMKKNLGIQFARGGYGPDAIHPHLHPHPPYPKG